jgi:hypothetical protein
MEGPTNYEYTALDLEDDIRVLELPPGACVEIIVCVLSHIHLSQNPFFEAAFSC